MANRLLLSSLLLVLAGCAAKPAPPPARVETGDAASSRSRRWRQGGSGESPGAIQIDVYQLMVPTGAISLNDEFWKRIDEEKIDVATYDLLLRNGVRAGLGCDAEWDYFKHVIDEHPAVTQKSAFGIARMGTMELSLKKNVEYQNIFYLTDQNLLNGRTYEQCENLIAVSFQPAPRKPEQVRLSVCPVVRSLRTRLQFSLHNEEREISDVRPEQLYDLNLRIDCPLDSFLVVAPSTLARRATSLGGSFLINDGMTEQFEQVLLFVPHKIPVAE